MAIDGQVPDTFFVKLTLMTVGVRLTHLQWFPNLIKQVLLCFITEATIDQNAVAGNGQPCASRREASLHEGFLLEGGLDGLADIAVCLGRVFLTERGRGNASLELRRCRVAQHAAEPLINHARQPSQSLCLNSRPTSEAMYFLHRTHELGESS
jgi:hypothetical protein